MASSDLKPAYVNTLKHKLKKFNEKCRTGELFSEPPKLAVLTTRGTKFKKPFH
jgi:hypothetical protein